MGAWNSCSKAAVPFWYSITDRCLSHLDEFRSDMVLCVELLRTGAIHPVVIAANHAAAKNVHARIDAGGLGSDRALPWSCHRSWWTSTSWRVFFGTPSP